MHHSVNKVWIFEINLKLFQMNKWNRFLNRLNRILSNQVWSRIYFRDETKSSCLKGNKLLKDQFVTIHHNQFIFTQIILKYHKTEFEELRDREQNT